METCLLKAQVEFNVAPQDFIGEDRRELGSGRAKTAHAGQRYIEPERTGCLEGEEPAARSGPRRVD